MKAILPTRLMVRNNGNARLKRYAIIASLVIVEIMLYHHNSYAANIVASSVDVATTPVTSIVVPYGSWLGPLLISFWGLVGTGVSYYIWTKLSAPLQHFLSAQLIESVTSSVIAQTAGAIVGQQLNVSTINTVIANAATFVVENYPQVSAWAGEQLKPMILAFMAQHNMVPPEAHADPMGDPKFRLVLSTPAVSS